MVNVKVVKLNELAKLPMQAKPGDACFDICATSFEVLNGSVVAVGTGLAFELPAGYEMQVRCRSGFAAKGVFVVNGIGTVDEGYRGEVKVLLGSVSSIPFKNPGGRSVKLGSIELSIGDRVAQIAVRPVPEVTFEETTELGDTDRGSGGFGSTGSDALSPTEPIKPAPGKKNPLRKD